MGMKISNRVKWYFVVAVALLFGMFFMLPHLCCDDDHDIEVLLWQSNLRSVYTLVYQYSAEQQGLAPDPKQWFEALMSMYPNFIYPEPIFGDNNQDDIWMCLIPWDDGRIPDDLTPYQLGKIPMLHSRVDLNPDGTSVAFWDGTVRLLSDEEFEALIDVEDSICVGCQFAVPSWMYGQEP
jgi:hypothetical protein